MQHDRELAHRVSKSRLITPLRRSARLQTLRNVENDHRHLPSPPSTPSQRKPQAWKKTRPLSHHNPRLDKQSPSKRPRVSPKSHEQLAEYPQDPVAHWIATKHWPKDFGKNSIKMSQRLSRKRKSTSLHHSDCLERLAENGIYMRASALMQRSSKDLCFSFLEGDRTPTQYPCYPPEQLDNVLDRIQCLNEARLQRDITPWIVPSAENLYLSGEITPDYIGEEIQAEWTRYATMGSTRPKPDYTAGLLRKAFTKEEIEKLQYNVSFERPWLFTPNLCFPFLMCEAKTGLEGIDKADRQNMHSASIAVRTIIELYKAAFGTTAPDRVNELYGQVLAFSVSHNNGLVNLYGHYAVLSDDWAGELKFYRYGIDMFSLIMHDGAERHKSYNFVLNVYEKFASEHRKRIKDALAFLPAPAKQTGLPFTASDLALEEMDSQPDSQNVTWQDNRASNTSPEPPSVAKFREQLERERMARGKMEEQIAKLLQEGKEREEKMEQQKQESREREEKMERQQQELIFLLKQPRTEQP